MLLVARGAAAFACADADAARSGAACRVTGTADCGAADATSAIRATAAGSVVAEAETTRTGLARGIARAADRGTTDAALITTE